MCECKPHTPEPRWLGGKKYRVADFFDTWWDEYIKSPTEYIKPEQYKAVNAIRVCRTAALGIDIYTCPDCGDTTEIYHNCKNRFCPTCSWQDTVRWAERVKGQMTNLPHRHAVFTLPHHLIPLIKGNGKELLNILMRTSADTLKDWISHKYNLRIGVISVLHTFGETKGYHAHVHMIVSWGGIDNSTGALKMIKGEYVNYKFLQDKFRCKFEDSLIGLFDTGKLESCFYDRIGFMKFLKRINEKNWKIRLEPAMENPEAVIRYIGRYSKRACLSEYKITSLEGENISFRHKDYKRLDINNKPIERELTLNYREFFPRLLQHVPLPYFRIVRYYGFYSNRGGIAQEYIFKHTESIVEAAKDWVTLQKEKTGENPLHCQQCNKDKEYSHTVIEKKAAGKNDIINYRFERKYLTDKRAVA
ncbi:MAG: transposase [Bacteroidales bacterium]|nr:transposase [Bacteroidales bacterium]